MDPEAGIRPSYLVLCYAAALCLITAGPGNPACDVQERNYITLVEDLLALDPRDRHVVPQLMQLHAFSTLALSKALHTCAAGLTLLVLLDSFRDASDEAQAREFYAFLRDPDGAPPRGVLPDQAADIWQSFVLALVLPLPNVTLVRPSCLPECMRCMHAAPRALVALA